MFEKIIYILVVVGEFIVNSDYDNDNIYRD